MSLSIAQVHAPDDDIRALLDELNAALAQNYASEQRHGLALEALFRPDVSFFVARQGAGAVGCAGVAMLDDCAEVKRMYVRPQARGAGVAQALLRALEARARSAGRLLLRLETGVFQHRAIALYEREGFSRCPTFGPYRSMSANAIELSVFMEKRLGEN